MVVRRLLIAGVMFVSLVSPAYAMMVYPDVDYTHPYVRGIMGMTQAKLIQGYEDGLFRPDRGLSRIEALKIVLNSANIPTNGYSTTQYSAPQLDWKGNPLPSPTPVLDPAKGVAFPDIPVDSWYAPYVNTGEAKNIIRGYENGRFYPQSFVTRIEAYKMLFRAFGVLKDAPVEGENWFMPYVQYAINHNLTNFALDQLTNGQNMNDIITRAEFTDLAFRMRNISPTLVGSKFSNNSYPTVVINDDEVIDVTKFGQTTEDASIAAMDNHYMKKFNSSIYVYTAQNISEANAVLAEKFRKIISIEGIELAEKNYATMAYPFDRNVWKTPFENTGLTYEQWYAMKATDMLNDGYLENKTL